MRKMKMNAETSIKAHAVVDYISSDAVVSGRGQGCTHTHTHTH